MKPCVLLLVFTLSSVQAICQLEPKDQDSDYFIEEEDRDESRDTEVSPEDVIFKIKVSDIRYIYLIKKSWYLDFHQTLNEPAIGDTTDISDTSGVNDRSTVFYSRKDSVVCNSTVYAGKVSSISNRELKLKHESRFTNLNLSVDSVICIKYKSGYTDSLEMLSAIHRASINEREDFFKVTPNSDFKNSFIVNPASLLLMRQMQAVYSRYFNDRRVKVSLPISYSFRTYNNGLINYYKLWGVGLDASISFEDLIYFGIGYETGELLSYNILYHDPLGLERSLISSESTSFNAFSGFMELNFVTNSGFTVGGLTGIGIQSIDNRLLNRGVLRLQLNLGWSF